MDNKQPFYHRASVLFTATREVGEAEFDRAVRTALAKVRGVRKDSVEVEEFDEPEPGDPADLMG